LSSKKYIESASRRGLESAKPFCLKAMASSDAEPIGTLEECLQALALDCATEMNMEVAAVAEVIDRHSADLVAVQDVDGKTIGYMSSDFAT